MKILITGAAGFVGDHIHRHYLNTNVEIDILDTKWDPESSVERFVATNDKRYDIVYHCAAFVGGRKGIDGRPAYLHTCNTALDSLMFTWALKAKPGRFVYFSSSAAYPMAFQKTDHIFPFMPLKEGDIDLDEPLPPEATYGLSKLHGEQMARSVSAEVPVTVLRPFSGYGEDQPLDYPFPSLIERARRREDPFTVWGSGKQMRDWIHIEDVVNLATQAAEGGVDGPLNVCTGTATTFDELAELAMSTAGYSGEIRHLDQGRGNGVDYRVGDPTLMHQIYVPKIHLAEAVERALLER